MEEASTWTEDQKVNWSDIDSRYGLTQANRGQIIKEYLAEPGYYYRYTQGEMYQSSKESEEKASWWRYLLPKPCLHKGAKKKRKEDCQ